MLQESPHPELVPAPPLPIGHPLSLVFYAETCLSIVEAGTSSQVFSFWLHVIRTELQTISDEAIRTEALHLLQEVGQGSQYLTPEVRRPGESLPLITEPIQRLIEYLRTAAPVK